MPLHKAKKFDPSDRSAFDHADLQATVQRASQLPVAEPAGTDLCRPYHAIGVFTRIADVEHAVVDLRSVGFPLNQVLLVANQFPRPENLAGVELRDRFEAMRLGIPVERAHLYNDRIAQNGYVAIVNGNEDEIQRATSMLQRRGLQDLAIYDASAVNADSPNVIMNAPLDRPSIDTDTATVVNTPPDAASTPEVIIVDRRHTRRS